MALLSACVILKLLVIFGNAICLCHSAVDIRDKLENVARQIAVVYDSCLSESYGGIPLMDRNAFTASSYSNIESILLFPQWAVAFQQTMTATSSINASWAKHSSFRDVTRLSQYNEIYDYFMNHYGDGIPNSDRPAGLWVRDNNTDPQLSTDERWNNDDIFAQARLMGVNPLQVERVTHSGMFGVSWNVLRKQLNTTFNWNEAVAAVLGPKNSVEQAISRGQLYVVRYPLLANVTGDANADGAYRGRRMMSPVALFVSTNDKKSPRPFQPVAIQLGHNSSSPVFTNRSGYAWWTIAKMYVSNADGLVSQIVHHLVNSHLVSEAFAVSAFRQLTHDHPVHQLLKPHFQGLIGINTAGFKLLTSVNGSITNVAGFGHSGLLELVKLAYENWSFDKTDFVGDLRTRGVADPGLLTYYPYRDDGRLVHNVFVNYTKDYVDLYYCSDDEVENDAELQAWAKEVSEKHKGKNFPAKIQTKAILADILRRIIWVNSVQHAILNYPIKEFGSYALATPFTLFKRPSDWTSEEIRAIKPGNNTGLVATLPPYSMAVLQAGTATQLASLRLTNLLDYSQSISDQNADAKKLTSKYHLALVGEESESVQRKIEKQNSDRKDRGVLPYRYMQPKELPNSIAI